MGDGEITATSQFKGVLLQNTAEGTQKDSLESLSAL